MPLEKYHEKRDFKKTPEPKGKKHASKNSKLSFVIQKHAATRLHYDFRLELDGVLKSWAVPKGPCLDPQEKRLAVHVEDHPIEYGDFEGVIPKGEYGGGTVLVWDQGIWIPESDPHEMYKRGRLSFDLEGTKLHGGWSLVRMKDEDNWLLFKRNDEHAKPKYDITAEEPDSAVTGRDLETIAELKEKTWRSNRGPQLPAIEQPELATLVSEPPKGDEWIYELKLDGYRALALKNGDDVQLISRNNKDWTAALPSIAKAVARLPAKQAIFDGELVVLTEHGTTSFQLLQNALGSGDDDEVIYYLFDLLFLDGQDLRDRPLIQRKEKLSRLIRGEKIRYSEHLEGDGEKIFASACRLGAEGIIAKVRSSTYRSQRTKDWLKIKCTREQEVVIGGFTDPTGARKGIGALLLGVYEGEELVYAGKVGTGFTRDTLAQLAKKLKPLERNTSPFDRGPKRGKGIHFVEPKLVAQVAFTEWTDDGSIRHPSFKGLRADREARDVSRETEQPAKTPRAEKSELPLTTPDRILWPELGITKRELAEYYLAVADLMLPHAGERPLMVLRCPDGRTGQCFHQKHAMSGMSEDIHTVDITESRGTKPTLWIDSPAGLVGIAQMNGLEIHSWGARVDRIERPDRIVLDLDPDPDLPWERVVTGARLVRALLAELELESFVKTTGGKGLHVVVPIQRTSTWEQMKDLARAISEEMVRRDPKSYVAVAGKKNRGGKIYVDYLRNSRGATAVLAYSTRAREGAPISAPVDWDELDELESAADFDVRSMLERVANLERDPWGELPSVKQSIRAEMIRAFEPRRVRRVA